MIPWSLCCLPTGVDSMGPCFVLEPLVLNLSLVRVHLSGEFGHMPAPSFLRNKSFWLL